MSQEINKFVYSITSDSLVVRKAVAEQVLSKVSLGIPDQAIVALIRCTLPPAIFCCDQPSQQRVIATFLEGLTKLKGASVLKTVCQVLKLEVKPWCGSSSWAMGKVVLTLSWFRAVVDQVPKSDVLTDDVCQTMLMYFGEVNRLICNSSSTKYRKLVSSKLLKLLKKPVLQPLFQYCESKLDNFTAQDLPALNCIYYFYRTENISNEFVAKLEEKVLHRIANECLAVKIKPSADILISCQPVLKHISSKQFENIILPAVMKFMLRNPEIVLEAVTAILSVTAADLGTMAPEVLKLLSGQIISKDELCAAQAIQAVQYVAQLSSDKAIVMQLTDSLVALFNGSQGKLTVAQQKQNVLKSIENLSCHAVSGIQGIHAVSDHALSKMAPVFASESHEQTVLCALNTVKAWGSRYRENYPALLTKMLMDLVSNKGTTQSVRIRCWSCWLATGVDLNCAENVMKLCQIALDRSLSQPALLPLRSEALLACAVFLKLTDYSKEVDAKWHDAYRIIEEKQLFWSDQFIQSVDDDTAFHFAIFMRTLLLNRAYDISPNSYNSWCRVLLSLLLYRPYKVRTQARTVVNRLLGMNGGPSTASQLLVILGDLFTDVPLSVEEKEESTDTSSKTTTPSSKVCTMAVRLCCTIPEGSLEVKQQLVLDSFIVGHSPIILLDNSECWLSIIRQNTVDATKIVEDNGDFLLELLTKEENEKIISACMNDLTKVAGNIVWPKLIEKCRPILRNGSLFTVTKRDREIMLTAEGQLYNVELRESLLKIEVVPDKNIRRENKAYKFKDQLMEQELRKELEAKKGKSGPKLTPKQQQQVDDEILKESQLRATLFDLKRTTAKAIHLIEAAIGGSKASTDFHVYTIVTELLALMKSYLVADDVVSCWLTLGKYVFGADILASDMVSSALECNLVTNSAAYCTLRHLIVNSTMITKCWTTENLQKATDRNLKRINFLVSPKLKDSSHPLSPPAFTFIFPLLQSILLPDSKCDEEDKRMALVLLQLHVQHANSLRANNTSLLGVEQLPIEWMIETCVALVGYGLGVNGLASETLLCLAQSLSSMETSRLQSSTEKFLDMLVQPAESVRETGLRCIDELGVELNRLQSFDYLKQRIWISRFDSNEYNEERAENIWNANNFVLSKKVVLAILNDITADVSDDIRQSACDALFTAVTDQPKLLPEVLTELLDLFKEFSKTPAPVIDEFGRLVTEGGRDKWEARVGLGLAIQKLCSLMPASQVPKLFDALFPGTLTDRSEKVRHQIIQAASEAIKLHGQSQVQTLLPMFENLLDNLPNSRDGDSQRQCIIILLGTLAQHLDSTDARVRPIVARLIETLSTPSQQVQEAVALCLPPLVPAIKETAPSLLEKLLCLLGDADTYGERKGAAYGLAGLIKGMGILTLKQSEVMSRLTVMMTDKKQPKFREGALLALEMLCKMLGKLFEPYVVHMMQHLLVCFGDPDQHVRAAAQDCSKAVMAHLSAHGVKLVLPALLTALEEDSWRTKAGSVELLGAMAFCAPKQLATCLPQIVPKLIGVLSDTHLKVQKAGEMALTQIGQVIRNPEVHKIRDDLLSALSDPSKKTTSCLQKLTRTNFTHHLDAPSLALIMPVVERAFDDRSTETRRLSAQLVGNIYRLADQKDMEPYLITLLPGLQKSLLDPVPEVRAVAAHALGAMVQGLGDDGWNKLYPWLIEHLTSEVNVIDRQGAAQGLSEVIGGLGEEKLEAFMPTIIEKTRTDAAQPPNIRDGYLMMFIYLPASFGDRFLIYLDDIIPILLEALADENESVRDTALQAGQQLIDRFCDTAIQSLMPQLELALLNGSWRIRLSAVQLLGHLLFTITGVTGKMTTESAEDDTFGTESSSKLIMKALGAERRQRVLAGLYMSRCDVALDVRHAAQHIWKVIVANTPRTLKEILSSLFKMLLGSLADGSTERQQTAARTLGELVRKMGDRILVDIIPVLEAGLKSSDPDQRQGVCVALSEIMNNTTKEMVLMYAEKLVPTVRLALADELPNVREAAARTFDALLTSVGNSSMDDVLAPLLVQLDEPEVGDNILKGLEMVVSTRSRSVMPYLMPKLIGPPIKRKALARLSAMAGETLSRLLPKILPALMDSLAVAPEGVKQDEECADCLNVLLAAGDDHGIQTVIEQLLKSASQPDTKTKAASARLLAAYIQETKTHLIDYFMQLLRGILMLYREDDQSVLDPAADALGALLKPLDSRQQTEHLYDVRRAVKDTASGLPSGATLPGFGLSKGVQPILTLIREVVLNGGADMKETAAITLSEVLTYTNSKALKPQLVINVTGPLIRVLGDRYQPPVKVAILAALTLLLEKVGTQLRPFLPQLQSTFLKALADPSSRQIRLRAAISLSRLLVIHTKQDTLLTDVLNSAKTADEPSLRESFLICIRALLTVGKTRFGTDVQSLSKQTLISLLGVADDMCCVAAGAAFGAFIAHVASEDDVKSLVNDQLFVADASADWHLRHGRATALQIVLCEVPDRIMSQVEERLTKTLLAQITADRVPIALCGLRSTACVLVYQMKIDDKSYSVTLLQNMARSINHSSNDVKQLAAQMMHYLAINFDQPLDLIVMKAIIPPLVNGSKEKNSGVRCSSEEALVSVFHLRKQANTYNTYCNSLDSGFRDSLVEVYTKVLQKQAKQSVTNLPPIDDTVQV